MYRSEEHFEADEDYDAMGTYDAGIEDIDNTIDQMKMSHPTMTVDKDSVLYLTYQSGSSNKFHVFFLAQDKSGDWFAFNGYARIGYAPRIQRIYGPASIEQCRRAMSKKITTKERKGYSDYFKGKKWYATAETYGAESFDAHGSQVCSECKTYGYWDDNPICPMCRFDTPADAIAWLESREAEMQYMDLPVIPDSYGTDSATEMGGRGVPVWYGSAESVARGHGQLRYDTRFNRHQFGEQDFLQNYSVKYTVWDNDKTYTELPPHYRMFFNDMIKGDIEKQLDNDLLEWSQSNSRKMGTISGEIEYLGPSGEEVTIDYKATLSPTKILSEKVDNANTRTYYEHGLNFKGETYGAEMDYMELPVIPDSYGTDSATEMSGRGVPVWYGSAEDANPSGGSTGNQVVSWESGGLSSPSGPPSDIYWAEGRGKWSEADAAHALLRRKSKKRRTIDRKRSRRQKYGAEEHTCPMCGTIGHLMEKGEVAIYRDDRADPYSQRGLCQRCVDSFREINDPTRDALKTLHKVAMSAEGERIRNAGELVEYIDGVWDGQVSTGGPFTLPPYLDDLVAQDLQETMRSHDELDLLFRDGSMASCIYDARNNTLNTFVVAYGGDEEYNSETLDSYNWDKTEYEKKDLEIVKPFGTAMKATMGVAVGTAAILGIMVALTKIGE